MVSDGGASKVYFYGVPSMTLTGELSDVTLASAVVRAVDLTQMTHRPVERVEPIFPTYERRFAAIAPDGEYAFSKPFDLSGR